jgi:hypothetical protein
MYIQLLDFQGFIIYWTTRLTRTEGNPPENQREVQRLARGAETLIKTLWSSEDQLA